MSRPGAIPPLEREPLRFPEMVVSRLLERTAEGDAGRRRFVGVGADWLSYAEVEARARAATGALAAAGMRSGEAFGIFTSTRLELLDLYFGSSRLGAIVVPINAEYRHYMLEHVLNEIGIRVLFTEPRLLERVAEVAGATRALETLVLFGDDGAPRPSALAAVEVVPYERLADAAPVEVELPRLGPDDPNSIIFTSGTTGASKGVVLSNAHALSKAEEVVEICRIYRDDVIYAPLPLFHSFGLHRGVLTALVANASIFLRERFSASQYWEDAASIGATVGYCTMSMAQILTKAAPTPGDRKHRVSRMFAAPYDAAFEERFGVRVLHGYSMTEANNAIYTAYDDEPRPGAIGRLNPDWEVRLERDDGEAAGVGEPGEFLLRPKKRGLLMLGYYNRPEATVAAFHDLWFRTGDIGRVDEDGYYYFVDRKKDAIRRRGENISSWEVEQILRQHPRVVQAVALPYPSPVGEDDVWVVVAAQEAVSAAELARFCEERMPAYMRPRYIDIRTELPKTGSGKVAKADIRAAGLGSRCVDCGDGRREVA